MGNIRGYKYLGSTTGSAPVAAKVWWNSTEPGNSRLDMYFQMGQQYNVQTPGQTISFSGTSTYIYFYIYFYSGTNNAYTPTLEDLNVQLFTRFPKSNVKIDIGNDEVTNGRIRTPC